MRPDDIAFAPAVSYGMAQAAANLTLVRTQTVVTLAEQFPSNVYPWMDLAQRTGALFVAVPRPGDDDWTAALLSARSRAAPRPLRRVPAPSSGSTAYRVTGVPGTISGCASAAEFQPTYQGGLRLSTCMFLYAAPPCG
jgi:hypothetical protein